MAKSSFCPIRAHRYTEAICLGESLPAHKRSPEVEANLGVAYQLAGRKREAKQLFEQLRARPDLPDVVASVVNHWLSQESESEAETANSR
jgi:Flp pilus assembly protein TadD